MNKIIISLLFLCYTLLGLAQPINQTNTDGKKIGKWQQQYDNGQLKYKGQFENGYEVGDFFYYYPDGKIKSKMSFSEKGQLANIIIYYKSGTVQASGTYRNKLKHSTWKYWADVSTQLTKEENYDNGKKNGLWKVYYVGGGVASQVMWKMDVRHGEWKEFFENGRLKLSANFNNGKMDGPYLTYFLNGQISRKGLYVNGLSDGLWESFEENGTVKTIEKYRMGQQILEQRYENGVLYLEIDGVNHKVKDLRKAEDIETEEPIEIEEQQETEQPNGEE
jgi:antitoxin component YwqK of YwqJK toxin-antitoxin module